MSNPKDQQEQIHKEEKELLQLQAQKAELDLEIRELLLKTALVESEEGNLCQLEGQLRTIQENINTLRNRIDQRKKMLPELVKEQGDAARRLEELRKQIMPLARELMDSDTEVMKLYNQTTGMQERVNALEQRLCKWVVEGQYLSRRFGLNGSGLRIPGRPNFDDIWQRIRIVGAFRPTPPAAFSDKLKVLDGERNITEKKQRREKVQKQTAEFVEKHGGARVVQGS